MDIKKSTTEQLKIYMYDASKEVARLQSNLQMVDQEIELRQREAASATPPASSSGE
jgi:hypothetical protein